MNITRRQSFKALAWSTASAPLTFVLSCSKKKRAQIDVRKLDVSMSAWLLGNEKSREPVKLKYINLEESHSRVNFEFEGNVNLAYGAEENIQMLSLRHIHYDVKQVMLAKRLSASLIHQVYIKDVRHKRDPLYGAEIAADFGNLQRQEVLTQITFIELFYFVRAMLNVSVVSYELMSEKTFPAIALGFNGDR